MVTLPGEYCAKTRGPWQAQYSLGQFPKVPLFSVISGAQPARPISNLVPVEGRCLHSSSDGTCLVQMSPGLSAPGCLNSRIDLFLIFSCTQSCPVARCLTFPIPVRVHIPIAALESVLICTGASIPISAAKLCCPSASLAPFTTPYSSASPDESASVF